jgi:hypothetical protein
MHPHSLRGGVCQGIWAGRGLDAEFKTGVVRGLPGGRGFNDPGAHLIFRSPSRETHRRDSAWRPSA